MIRLWVGDFVKFYKHLHVAIKWFFFPSIYDKKRLQETDINNWYVKID